MTYWKSDDCWTCDRCNRREWDWEYSRRERGEMPAWWIHTMIAEDLCPDCQDQRYTGP